MGEIVLGVVAVIIALAICIEGLVWVRAERRRQDQNLEHLRALLARIDGDAGDG